MKSPSSCWSLQSYNLTGNSSYSSRVWASSMMYNPWCTENIMHNMKHSLWVSLLIKAIEDDPRLAPKSVTCVRLWWYGTNTNDHEPYAGIHTIFFWDCLVRWLETNNFTIIGRANKHHGELPYIRKHTCWSTTTPYEIYGIIFCHVSRSSTSCRTMNSLIPMNIFTFGWDSSVSIRYEGITIM